MQVMLLLSHHAQHMEHVRGEGMVGELEKPEAKGTAGERGERGSQEGKPFLLGQLSMGKAIASIEVFFTGQAKQLLFICS